MLSNLLNRSIGARVPAAIIAVALALPSTALAAPAGDDTDAAVAEHRRKAEEYYDADEFKLAAAELQEAYALQPTPGHLYNWAQAERLGGDCDKAIPLYRRVLQLNPDLRGDVETNILKCGGEVEAPPPDTPPEGTEDGNEVTDDGPPDKPVYKDWLGATLVGVGVGAGIAGGVLIAVGITNVNEAPNETNEGDYFDAETRGNRQATGGAVLLGVGGALILGGIIRYGVLASRAKKKGKKKKSGTTALVPGPGFGLALSGRF